MNSLEWLLDNVLFPTSLSVVLLYLIVLMLIAVANIAMFGLVELRNKLRELRQNKNDH